MLEAVCAHKTSLNLPVSGHAFLCYVYQFFLRFFLSNFGNVLKVYPNNISGIFSEVDRGFEPRLGQSKTIKLEFVASLLRT